jgi:hypothetical protein
MPRPKNPVPTYHLHKQSGQAVVTLNLNGVRRDMLLGKYGTPRAKPSTPGSLPNCGSTRP